MLNLALIFDDAITAFDEYASYLATPPLPAAVFMMQRDVINHYRHALTHYFALTLDEHYLQNSSLGTPYEKWAKFTNDDFDLLAFVIRNLLRYTSRLVHETECAGLRQARRFSEMANRSNTYTEGICDIKNQQNNIGIRIQPENILVKTAWATGPSFNGCLCVRSNGVETIIEHTTTGPDGNDHTVVITQAEYVELTRTLRECHYDIGDRSLLASLKADGMAEVDDLVRRNATFADLCNQYYATKKPATEFDSMNESWWV